MVRCRKRSVTETRLKALLVMSESFLVSPKPKVELGRPYAGVSRQRRKLLLALGATVALAGCGKKGELELPPAEPVLENEQPGGDAQ